MSPPSRIPPRGAPTRERTSNNDAFVRAWRAPRGAFGNWVKEVYGEFLATNLDLGSAARLIGTSPAELAAVLNLALMDSISLGKFDGLVPPKATWFDLPNIPPESIDVAIATLKARKRDESARGVVLRLVKELHPPTPSTKVAALPGDVLMAMSSRAKKFGALSPKSRRALFSMGLQRKNGVKPLSPAQIGYLENILADLITANVLVDNPKDPEVEMCRVVLRALEE
jgi:hypothetical protein